MDYKYGNILTCESWGPHNAQKATQYFFLLDLQTSMYSVDTPNKMQGWHYDKGHFIG